MTVTKTVFAAVIAAFFLFAAPALAQEEERTGIYAGVGSALLECSSCSDDLDRAPHLFAGWMFRQHFSAELGYIANAEFDGEMKYSTAYLTGIARLPVHKHFAVFGKLGAHIASVDNKGGDMAPVSNGAQFLVGGGVEGVYEKFAARIEVARLQSKVNYGGLSVIYRF